MKKYLEAPKGPILVLLPWEHPLRTVRIKMQILKAFTSM